MVIVSIDLELVHQFSEPCLDATWASLRSNTASMPNYISDGPLKQKEKKSSLSTSSSALPRANLCLPTPSCSSVYSYGSSSNICPHHFTASSSSISPNQSKTLKSDGRPQVKELRKKKQNKTILRLGMVHQSTDELSIPSLAPQDQLLELNLLSFAPEPLPC